MLRTAPALMAIALTTAACVSGATGFDEDAPLTPTARYPLRAEPDIDQIALAVHPTGLSQAQHAALLSLVARWSASGGSDVFVAAPSDAGEAATRMAAQVRQGLQDAAPLIGARMTTYQAPSPDAPILVGFEGVRAVVAPCGAAWGALTRTGDNRSASNFGCAVSANLAAQIADPRDIRRPKESDPADAARRDVILRGYRAGEATSAEPELLLQRQAVSQVVQ